MSLQRQLFLLSCLKTLSVGATGVWTATSRSADRRSLYWANQANFSYLWKFVPDVPNSFEEILFEKPQNLQRMYDHELINVLAPSNFAVFNCCYFVVAVVVTYCKELKLQKTNSRLLRRRHLKRAEKLRTLLIDYFRFALRASRIAGKCVWATFETTC